MKSQIVIVDENDRVIGSKKREDVGEGDIYRATALWIKNSKGEHLLARRAFTKKYDPGKWGPAVAGTVEVGETYESNIRKEAEEEIGLKDITLQTGQNVKTIGDQNQQYFGQMYLLLLDKSAEEFVLQKEEVEEMKWFSDEELKRNLREHPEQFVKTMEKWVEIFC